MSRDDGVMVGELCIVHISLGQVQAIGERGQGSFNRPFVGQSTNDVGQFREHVVGQVPGLGAGIRQQFVFFVKALGQVEGFLCGVAESFVSFLTTLLTIGLVVLLELAMFLVIAFGYLALGV